MSTEESKLAPKSFSKLKSNRAAAAAPPPKPAVSSSSSSTQAQQISASPSSPPSSTSTPSSTTESIPSNVPQSTESATPTEQQTTTTQPKPEAKDERAVGTKHPLQREWTYFYEPPKQKGSGWASNAKKIVAFSFVEDFWSLYNNIVPPSKLPHGSAFQLFRDNIKPEWEDKGNERGGEWKLPEMRGGPESDDAWMNTILAMIGEQLDCDAVTGAAIYIRKKGNRLSVWMGTDDEETVKRVGEKFKKVLGGIPLAFHTFRDQKENKSNPRFTV